MTPTTTTPPNDTSPAGRPGHTGGGESASSKLYHAIMTPINFVTFLVSLYLVDCGYEDERMRRHAAGRRGGQGRGRGRGRLPVWLQRLLFSPRPYEWVDQRGAAPPNEHEERFYYHTKQKKLMKMEAADAFGLRAPVLLVLSSLAVVAAWAAWRLGWGLLYRIGLGIGG